MPNSPSLRILPLGGLGEVGMNCLAIEQDGQALVIDCGVTFDDRGIGVDVVHPDFTALDDVRVAGLFVTHGHEDHIGAIPYFLRRHDVPVFGPPYALGLVRDRAQEHEILDHVRMREVTPRSRIVVGPFEVEPIRVTHSIADATALAIRTAAGTVVHTGDFKFDETPPDGEAFDVERFERIASEEGVRLLLSDSTNVDATGPTGSERGVGDALDAIVAGAEQAVVVALFASNVHRLRLLGETARRHGRKLVALGRSVSMHSRVARATPRSTGPAAGEPYLEWPSDLVWPADRARELPRRAILGLATGTQGEATAALSRLGRGEHPALDVGEGDVVVLSSRVIPGNEPRAMRVMTDLLRRGVDLRTWWSDRAVHVSGHAHRDEQERMIVMTSPRAFIPLHGTLHHLLRHAALARKLGVPEVCVLENGQTGELTANELRKGPRFHSGRVHVFARRALAPSVLHEREALAAHGAAHVTVVIDERGRVEGEIGLLTRGVLDELLDAHVLAAARNEARAAVEELLEGPPGLAVEQPVIAEAARQAVRRAIARVLGFKPVTTVSVVRAPR
jgi:ribonuclease J